MKNGDLIVKSYLMEPFDKDDEPTPQNIKNDGVRADSIDLDLFTCAGEMGTWEYAAYHAYTDERCNAENIWTLEDLFGIEFQNKFHTRRAVLYAQDRINELNKELVELQASIARYEDILIHPEKNEWFPIKLVD